MTKTKRLYYNACSLIPTRILRKWVAPTTLLPYQHLVSDQEIIHIKHLYPYKNCRQFREDLDYLLKYNHPVGVDEIKEAIVAGKSLRENAFLLSFDDGFREVYDVIAPILSAKGIPAVFFINPAFVDNRILFYRCKMSLIIEKLSRGKDDISFLKLCEPLFGQVQIKNNEELIRSIKKINNTNQHVLDVLGEKLELSFDDYLKQQVPFLTTSQLESLHDSGFSIGAHSWDHPYYGLISKEERIQQTVESALYVKKIQPEGPTLFSFPHSDQFLPQSFFNEIIKGQIQIDLFFGTQNQKTELHNRVLHRFNAERPDLPLEKQMNGLLMLMLIRQFFGSGKVIRK